MGKTVRLTEEQIRRFFGEGFGKRLLGEDSIQKIPPTPEFSANSDVPKMYQRTLGHSFDSGKVDAKGRPIVTPEDPDKDGLFYTNQDYIPREVAGGTDLPGFGGAVAKIADFAGADLNKKNALAGNSDSEALLVKIREVFDSKFEKGTNMNIIDVLKIIHEIKGEAKTKSEYEKSKGDEITEDDAIQFLNSISIDYILSNFITVNAPDYVFWRLKNLSKNEIENIETTYGRNFEHFGERCDGCGATTWKTTVTPYEHDDAHINFEYMGGDAAKGKLNEGKKVSDGVDDGIMPGSNFNGAGKVYEKRLPFQIHHMNENPGDNSPLNLSCLCPNCHAITGSYGKQKGDLDAKAFDILKNNTTVNDGSLNGFLDDSEVKSVAEQIKKGKFDSRTIGNRITGVDAAGVNIDEFTFDPENSELQARVKSFGVENPKDFIQGFNELFRSIYSEGARWFNNLLKESRNIFEENEGEDKNEVPGKEQKREIDGLEFYFTVSLSSNRNISLRLFCGKKPYIFSAFRNNAIPLTRMYYETAENKAATITHIRNKIFGAALNSVKEYKNKMSDWVSRAPGWATKFDNDKNGNIVIDTLTKMKPGTHLGQRQRAGLLEPSGSDNNAALTRQKKAASQTRSTGEFSDPVLSIIEIILTTPDDDRAKMGAYSNKEILGDSLIKYLLDMRQIWAGKSQQLGRTKEERRNTVIDILNDRF